jgi:hypothetical protein
MKITGCYELRQVVFERAPQMLQVVPTVDLLVQVRSREPVRSVAMVGLVL